MGAIYSQYQLTRLKRRLFWPREKIESLRKEKLSRLLHYCYKHSPYYREQFELIGAKPDDFQSPADLVNFPVLEKETLRDRIKEFLNPEADQSDWMRYSSSGSTGIPLELWYHPSERLRMGFTITRTFLFHGLKPWNRMANLTEPRHFESRNRWYHRLGLMNEKFLSIFEDSDVNLATLRKINPYLIIGFPSILMIIGRKMQQDNGLLLRPKLMFTLAEVLTEKDRQVLREQWGTDPVDVYGSNETGFIAFQCQKRQGYHINSDSLHVEILNGNTVANPGERGEIVVTSFDLRVMPIIRYRVGDITHRLKGTCSCGCNFPLLGPVAGRSDGFIVGENGKLFSALETSLLLHPLQGISRYRLVQERLGHVIVEWVAKENSHQPENKIRQELKKHLGNSIEIETRQVPVIRREKSGKIRSVISKLRHPFWEKEK